MTDLGKGSVLNGGDLDTGRLGCGEIRAASAARFTEYVTSGAFSLTLSRQQIARLSMVASGADTFFGASDSSLERKGLIEPVAAPTDRDPSHIEFRATLPGLICLGLLRTAGLINGGDDAIATELASLRGEVEQCRAEAVKWRTRGWSAMARKESADASLADANAEIKRLTRLLDAYGAGITLKRAPPAYPLVLPRDKCPDIPDAELMGEKEDA